MTFTDKERDQTTAEAIADPQVGDRFTERYAFWMYVVAVGVHHVVTMEATTPCTFPEDGKVKHYTKADFKKRFEYTSGGYWVSLMSRGENVEGWW